MFEVMVNTKQIKLAVEKRVAVSGTDLQSLLFNWLNELLIFVDGENLAFSNMKYNVNTKKFVDVHVPIDSHPPFKALAEEIIKRKMNITIISESPILEQDSLKMMKIFRSLGLEF